MREKLVNLFYENGFFKFARNIWFASSIFFLIGVFIYLFKGFFGNMIFYFGGFLISYSLKKFCDSYIKAIKYKKDTKEVIDKKSGKDLEIIDANGRNN